MICPRPFFVEHGVGHGPNWMRWSTGEYRHVDAFYRQLGIAERTRFYPFPGGHNGRGGIPLLNRWLAFVPTRAPTGVYP